MKRSLAQRGTALVLATVLNVGTVWLLAHQPAAGLSAVEQDTAGAAGAEALAGSAQPSSGRPAGRRADAALPQGATLDGRCISICLLLRA